MTPSETTDEKRSRSYWGFVLVGAVLIAAAVFIFWPRAGGRQQLSLTVLGYSTNSLVGTVVFRRPMVFAHVAVTNNSDETLVLWSEFSPWPFFVEQTRSGSETPERTGYYIKCPLQPTKLLPGQGFTFEAGVPSGGPCKAGVSYLNGRLAGRIWQKLPLWLTKKLSWASPWRTATTEVIDLSKPLK